METEIHRPTPILPDTSIALYHPNAEILSVLADLEAGKPILVTTSFGDGMQLLKEISSSLRRKMPHESYAEQRAYRAAYRTLSHLVLLEIADHRLTAKKSPEIGWLRKLYPDVSDFLLPFPLVQGLNSSWQWYQKGVKIPVLRNRIHPYYGTYFPTRFDHLILFDNFLKRYQGPKKAAMEVGIGSGVLSLQMVQHGFQKVFATDTNPNAIVGLNEYMADTKLSRKIELDHAPYFGKWEKPCELIVFNPPWLPVSMEQDGQEEAMRYDADLFPTFFAAAKDRLLPDGKLVILFSNLARVTDQSSMHPIEQELDNNGRFVLEKFLDKKVQEASEKTTRDAFWRAEERAELWVLKHA